MNSHRRDREHALMLRRRELDDIAHRLDGLIGAIADGLRTPSLKGKLEDLERRKAELETILSQPEPPAPRRHPNLSELYRQKDEALHEAFADPEIRTEAIEILRDLIDRITLYPITEPSPNR